MLTKAEILSAQDLQTKRINVPEWGGDIILKSMTGTERDAYEAKYADLEQNKKLDNVKKYENVRAKFLQRIIVDENGDLVFTTADIIELGNKTAGVLARLWREGRKLSGLSEEDEEEAEKN